MKSLQVETYGNNYPTDKIRRIEIPLFTQQNEQLQRGLKYFFPENPTIDQSEILGIEANLRMLAFINSDISDQTKVQVDQSTANFLYLVLYNQNNEEIYYNLPVRSLFTINEPFEITPKIQKRIKPFQSRIKTRMCYAYVPANVPAPVFSNVTLSLTFFYK
jgi:hypothetical protein